MAKRHRVRWRYIGKLEDRDLKILWRKWLMFKKKYQLRIEQNQDIKNGKCTNKNLLINCIPNQKRRKLTQ